MKFVRSARRFQPPQTANSPAIILLSWFPGPAGSAGGMLLLEITMYSQMKSQPICYQVNWRGVMGLAAMALGSVLGWIMIVTAFRAVLR